MTGSLNEEKAGFLYRDTNEKDGDHFFFFFFLAELLIFWRPWEAQDSQHFSYVISVYPLFNPEQILIQISFSTSPQVNAHVTIISWALWELGLRVLTV